MLFRKKKDTKDTKATHIKRAKVELGRLNELIKDTQETIKCNGKNGLKPDTTEILYRSICRKVLGKKVDDDETKVINNLPRADIA